MVIIRQDSTRELAKQNLQSNISVTELKSVMLPILNEQRYKNDAENRSEFDGFTDSMILAHYLLRDTHINKDRGKSEKTFNAYRMVLNTFHNDCFEYAEEIGIDLSKLPKDRNNNVSLYKGLSKIDIEKYVDWFVNESPYVKANGKYAASTLAQKLVIIKGFLKKLYEWDYISFPIHTAFKSVSLTKHDKPYRDISPAQVLYLLDLFKEERNVVMFTFIHVLTTTGIRNNELCTLRVGDVRYDSINNLHYLHVIAKGNKDREIPLRPKTLETIRYFRKCRGALPIEEQTKLNPNAPLFMTGRGNAYTPAYLSQLFKKEIENLSEEKLKALKDKFTYYSRSNPNDKQSDIVTNTLNITPHVFRHAFAIISQKSGLSIDSIQMSLGHADRRTTEIYLESIIKKEQNAINQWNDELLKGYI